MKYKYTKALLLTTFISASLFTHAPAAEAQSITEQATASYTCLAGSDASQVVSISWPQAFNQQGQPASSYRLEWFMHWPNADNPQPLEPTFPSDTSTTIGVTVTSAQVSRGYTFNIYTQGFGEGDSFPHASVYIDIEAQPCEASITVNSDMATEWTVNPGAHTREGGTYPKKFTVYPGTNGSMYTISADCFSDFCTIDTSDAEISSALFLTLGESKDFNIKSRQTNPPPAPPFTLSNGGDRSVSPGNSASNTITVTQTSGTPQSVSLTAVVNSTVANKPTVSLSPTSCTPNTTCTSSLTINTAANTPAGSYQVSVSGRTDPNLPAQVTEFTLVVGSNVLEQDLKINGQDNNIAIQNGTNIAYSMSAKQYNHCALSAQLQGSIYRLALHTTDSPSSDQEGTSYSNIMPPSNSYYPTPTKSTTFYLSCESFDQTYTIIESIVVSIEPPVVEPSFDFSMSNGGSVSAAQGDSAVNNIALSLVSGDTELVGLSVTSGLPAGTTASFSSTSCSPTCNSILTLQTGASTPVGTYTINVRGVGGGITRNTPFSFTVTSTIEPPLSKDPVLNVNSTGSTGVSITRVSGTSGTVGTTNYSFTQATPIDVVLRAPASAGGRNFVNWTGQCNGIIGPGNRDCYVYVDLEEAKTITANYDGVTSTSTFNYSLSDSGTTTVTKGGSNTYGQNVITKTLITGPTQPVSLSLSGVPSGVTYTISNNSNSPSSPTSQSSILFTVSPSTAADTYSITVTGSPLNKRTSFNLRIENSPNIVVSCTASPSSPVIGQAVTWTATISGGVPPYTSYAWSGTNVPTSPAPSTNPFSITYSTIGQKTVEFVVTDSLDNTGSCTAPSNPGSVYINFNPEFEEF